LAAWGLICGDGWSLLEASVVCRQLGYGFASDALQTDFFGGSSDDIVMSGVECRGNEFSLGHCLHDDMETLHCPGQRDNIASVVCTRGIHTSSS
jgi:lysyl oxidase-like protein 2/3/4